MSNAPPSQQQPYRGPRETDVLCGVSIEEGLQHQGTRRYRSLLDFNKVRFAVSIFEIPDSLSRARGLSRVEGILHTKILFATARKLEMGPRSLEGCVLVVGVVVLASELGKG